MNYSPNTFKSSGRWYTLNISLVPDSDMFPDDTCVSLDANSIEEFSYSSELNSLLLTGKITYVDQYGLVDKLLEQQQCQCQVTFAQNNTKEDGSVVFNQIDKKNVFMHNFLVKNVKIVKREGTRITYDIELVSSNWYSCAAKIAFSDNDLEPETLFDILKKCLQLVKLKAGDSFDKVKTDVKMNYISQANDNMLKVFAYLMDKLYFWPKKDNALKFLVYNWYKNTYELLDLTDKDTYMGMSTTVLSFFKDNAELLIQADESNIGSYSNGMSKTDLYKAMFSKDVYSYDLEKNSFKLDSSADDKALVNFMNKRVSGDDYQLKYHDLSLIETLKYVDNMSYWNNPLDVYFSMIDSMYATGALTLNTTGELLRQSGYCITLGVDRNLNALTDDSAQSYNDLKTKYIGFDGSWMALKVVSVICPKKEQFRQKIALFRNYTKRPKT